MRSESFSSTTELAKRQNCDLHNLRNFPQNSPAWLTKKKIHKNTRTKNFSFLGRQKGDVKDDLCLERLRVYTKKNNKQKPENFSSASVFKKHLVKST
jgi:hypothetical protein